MSRRDIREQLAGVKQTLVDRAVSYFDPVAGARRLRARYMTALAGGYVGGSRSRRQTKEWKTTIGGTADSDLLPDLDVLRDRSRDLVRNSPLAGGAIATVVTNVVGTGLSLKSCIDRELLGMSEEQAAAWQRNAEREFNTWAESADCDITRGQTFYELQDLALRSTLESGDIFFLTPTRDLPRWPYKLCLQAIEADRCRNKAGQTDKPNLAAGIELDGYGAPVNYHFAKPPRIGLNYATSTDVDVVQAFGSNTGRRNVIHLFERRRPGQRRGEPYLAGVIEPLKQIDRYSEAEIMAAVVSSMFTVFVESESASGLDPAAPGGLSFETGASSSDNDIKLAAGAIVDLAPGEKVNFADPGRPNANFDPFVQAILRQIGVRLELPFEVLIKHYTASYSAARAAILDAWRFFKKRRAWLASKFCQPVYELFLEEAIASGRISAPGFFDDPVYRAAYSGAEWHGDGAGSIDPVKEVEAAQKRVDLGISTRQAESIAFDGGDWQAKQEQLERESKARRAAGFDQDPAAAPPAAAPAAPAGADTETGDNEAQPGYAAVVEAVEQSGARVTAAIAGMQPPTVTFSAGAIQVNVASPSTPARKVVKDIQRDGEGLATRVTETESDA